MDSVFSEVKSPGSYSGINTLFRHIKEKGYAIKKKDLIEWLRSKDAYTKHKPIHRHFRRNKTIVYHIDEQWQMDIVDLKTLTDFNRGYKYILTCIDIFSKHAWAIPLRNKTGLKTLKAFKTILKTSGRAPHKLQTDEGKEFLNKDFQSFLKQNDIIYFTVKSEMKASVVERFNRTLKTKMWKYFTDKNTSTYIDVLPDLLESYNSTYHRSIKMKPIDVNHENSRRVWENLYGYEKPVKVNYKFQPGDLVRISMTKLTFKKGYLGNWSEEIFKIKQQIPRIPVVYRLNDLNNKTIEGIFYEPELQKVKSKDYFRIEHVIKTKKVKGKKKYLVKWFGYSEDFNSWVDEADMQ